MRDNKAFIFFKLVYFTIYVLTLYPFFSQAFESSALHGRHFENKNVTQVCMLGACNIGQSRTQNAVVPAEKGRERTNWLVSGLRRVNGSMWMEKIGKLGMYLEGTERAKLARSNLASQT